MSPKTLFTKHLFLDIFGDLSSKLKLDADSSHKVEMKSSFNYLTQSKVWCNLTIVIIIRFIIIIIIPMGLWRLQGLDNKVVVVLVSVVSLERISSRPDQHKLIIINLCIITRRTLAIIIIFFLILPCHVHPWSSITTAIIMAIAMVKQPWRHPWNINMDMLQHLPLRNAHHVATSQLPPPQQQHHHVTTNSNTSSSTVVSRQWFPWRHPIVLQVSQHPRNNIDVVQWFFILLLRQCR